MTNATTVLAAGTPPETWPGMGAAGSLVFLAICTVTFLLWKNMNRQIKKVDSTLPTADDLIRADIAAGTADPRMAARYRAREARRRQVGPNAIIGTGPITTGGSTTGKPVPKPVRTPTRRRDAKPTGSS